MPSPPSPAPGACLRMQFRNLKQPPGMVDTRNTLISLYLGNCVNRKILWLTDSKILMCVNHTI